MRPFHILACQALACAAALAAVIGSANAAPLRIVALGDSLTAGYQLPASAALPAAIERNLRAAGHDVRIENAGVSGDTTAGGLERLEWAIGDKVDGAIVALGANDMLRGLDPARAEKALDEILRRLAGRKIEVLLVGMLAAPSMGPEYVQRFNAIYPALAKRHGVLLYPFMLEGVAQNPRLNLADGIHPNREGVELIARAMQPAVEQLIARIRSASR